MIELLCDDMESIAAMMGVSKSEAAAILTVLGGQQCRFQTELIAEADRRRSKEKLNRLRKTK